jgi:uncharacterized protein YqjF (DUF2071 family)
LARTTYRLPYFWSSMRLAEAGDEISYDCRRRWPGQRTAASLARLEIGAPYGAGDLGELDHFLTARWALFSVVGFRRRFVRAWHEPWPLRRARLVELDDGLVAAARLPQPAGEPLVHYSPGVDVRIGRPER